MARFTKHSQMLLMLVVMHILSMIQRLASVGYVHGAPSSYLIDIANGLTFFSIITSFIPFILLATQCGRRKTPNLVFVAFMGFTILVDLGIITSYVLYSTVDSSLDSNRKQMAVSCMITIGLSTAIASLLIPLFLFCAPPDLKSHRPPGHEPASESWKHRN